MAVFDYKKIVFDSMGLISISVSKRFQLHYLGDIPMAGNSLSWPVDLTDIMLTVNHK